MGSNKFTLFISGTEDCLKYVDKEDIFKIFDRALANKQDYDIKIAYSEFITNSSYFIREYCSKKYYAIDPTYSSDSYVRDNIVNGVIIFKLGECDPIVADHVIDAAKSQNIAVQIINQI